MNTYRTQFIARCPSDGQRIFYNLEMRSDDTIMVESINGVLEEITDDYQESIAQRLTEAFPRCSIRLHGVHQGIEIVSELPKDNSYLDAITVAPPQASEVDERAAGVFSEFNACMHRETCRAALAGTDRHVLQAQGKHPAPCAKFCESKAYEIDARSLRAQIEVLEHYRKVYGQVSGILACVAETGPIEPGDEITVQRLKLLVADFDTYVQRCQAKDALLRQALEALETDDWQKKLQAAIDIRNHTSPKGATQ